MNLALLKHVRLGGAATLAAAVLVAATILSSAAAPSAAPGVRVERAWARPGVAAPAGAHGSSMIMGPGTSAIYMTLHNTGPDLDRLLRAETDVATAVELHETRMEGGMSRMHKLQAIEIPAGGRVTLRPGGLHIMLLGLKRDLREGAQFTATLHFERARAVRAAVPVRHSAP